MKDLTGLFAQVAASLPEGAWCPLEKAQTLAAIVVAQRPRLVVELGVWTGDSLIPQLLALKCVGSGSAIAIDPWSAEASIEGQVDPANVQWWGRQEIHEQALVTFTERLRHHGLESICQVVRQRSDDVEIGSIGEIDVLHCDSNHGDVAIREVERFGGLVSIGGLLVMDDLQWSGGSVLRARDRAIELGFVQRYFLGTGCVLQRVRA